MCNDAFTRKFILYLPLIETSRILRQNFQKIRWVDPPFCLGQGKAPISLIILTKLTQ